MIKRFIVAALAASAFAGLAYAQTALGPNMTSVTTNSGGLMNALPANPSRRGVTICNEHASNTVTFTLGTLSPVGVTTGRVLASGNLVTSCFSIGSTQGFPTTGAGSNVGAQINILASGTSTPVTFIEYY
jgi:hypothetical protein